MIKKYKGSKPATLSDALLLLSETDKIAIGSDSAFMFIGTVAQWHKDEAFLSAYYRTRVQPVYGVKRPAKFKPFPERKIKDIFYRRNFGEPDILTLTVEGTEIGAVWFEHEYNDFMRRHRNDLETT